MSLDVPTLDALVTVINALAAGAALIIHAWGHTHPREPRRKPTSPEVQESSSDSP